MSHLYDLARLNLCSCTVDCVKRKAVKDKESMPSSIDEEKAVEQDAPQTDKKDKKKGPAGQSWSQVSLNPRASVLDPDPVSSERGP